MGIFFRLAGVSGLLAALSFNAFAGKKSNTKKVSRAEVRSSRAEVRAMAPFSRKKKSSSAPKAEAVIKKENDKPLSLGQTVQLAISTHPAILASKARRNASYEDIIINRASMLPKIDTRFSTGYEDIINHNTRNRIGRDEDDYAGKGLHRDSAEIKLTQLLFDGFASSNMLTYARRQAEAADEAVLAHTEKVALVAVKAHVNVLRYRRLEEVAKENVAVCRDILKSAMKFKREGSCTLGDVRHAQSRVALAQSQLIAIQKALNEAEADFVFAIGMKPGKLLVPEVPELKKLIDNPYEQEMLTAFENLHAIKSAKREIEANSAAARARKGDLLPKINLELSGAYGRGEDGYEEWDRSCTGLLTMDFNIWDGGAKTAKIRKAKAKLEESYKELSLLKRTAEQNLAVARGALKTTIKIMPILQEKLESIEAAASDYAVQFNRGRRQISGLLDTRKEFYEAKASVVDLQMTQIYTAFQVLAAKGTLINHLKVKTN